MASLFEKHPGELHFYPNRTSRSDGGEPLLGWTWLAYFLGVVSLSAAVFMVQHDLYRSHPLKFLLELFILALVLRHIVVISTRVVFSARDKRVSSAFLFFRWNPVPFRELADIRFRDQEIGGRHCFSYVVTRKNRYRPPIRLTCQTPDPDRLEPIAREALPLLESMLPVTAEAAEVQVEEVEVPVARAEALLHGDEEAASPTRTIRKGKLKFYAEKDGVYRISLWPVLARRLLVGLGALAGVTLLSFLQEQGTGLYVPVIALCVVLALFVLIYPDCNTDMNIDGENRQFLFHTRFGKEEHIVPFERLVTFNLKGDSTLRLCMVLEGSLVDPCLCVSRSPDRIKAVHQETCAILGLNPNAWYDG